MYVCIYIYDNNDGFLLTPLASYLPFQVTFPLSIGLLQGYLQEQMISAGFVPTGWAQPVLTIANLAGFRGAEAKTQQVKAILDRPLLGRKMVNGGEYHVSFRGIL
jgi:hypothetical protein